MAKSKQEAKVKEAKVKAANAGESKAKKSVGFLRASERANLAVTDIPLNFLSDLGIMPDQMELAKAASHKFISGLFGKLNSMAEAPGNFYGSLGAKLPSMGASKKAPQTPVVKPKPEAKKASPEAKKPSTKTATKATVKAAVKAKPKAKPKAKAAAKPKSMAKVAPKAKAEPAKQPIGAMKGPRPSDGIH